MKSRREFNQALLKLLNQMEEEGEEWLIDFVKRSDQEQKRLFDAGLSKCDGISILSWHQFGRACDIYFQDCGTIVNPKKGHEYWHQVWEELGGKPMIQWDQGHFEG